MASTSSKTKPLTYAISYGFVGGPFHARKFRKLMSKAGYRLAEPAEADIIIAHSAGCWLIPLTARPKLVIYIGMPLTMARKRKAWFSANVLGLIKEPLRGLYIRSLSLYYWARQFNRNLDILLHPKIGQPNIFQDVPAVFIANRTDPWPLLDDYEPWTGRYNWAFVGLPGTHDDIWEHPERYVKLIDHYAGLLA